MSTDYQKKKKDKKNTPTSLRARFRLLFFDFRNRYRIRKDFLVVVCDRGTWRVLVRLGHGWCDTEMSRKVDETVAVGRKSKGFRIGKLFCETFCSCETFGLFRSFFSVGNGFISEKKKILQLYSTINSATKSRGLGHGLGLRNTQAQAVGRRKPERRPRKAWLAAARLQRLTALKPSRAQH